MVAPTFKKATDTAPGDATKYGAPDVKYAFDVLDGTHSTDRIQASVVEGATPETKKIGGYFGGIYTAGATLTVGQLTGSLHGYTQGLITSPTATSYFSDANGRYARNTSGAVSGNDAGFNVNVDATTNPIIAVRGQQNARFKCKFRMGNAALSSNAVVRAFIGLTSATGLATGDAPWGTGVAHFALLLKSAGSNYLISRNDAAGASVEVDTTIARGTAINTLEIKTVDAGVTWSWNLNGTTGSYTTDVPPTTTPLYPIMQIETVEAVAKVIETWYWIIETSA